MNFSDIFKKDFIASYTSENISVPHIAAVLFITAVIACYIFVVYRLITKKTFYSKNFNISLAAIAVITAGIILAVQSSIVISLGMVGALSIVRFRTAIKDPMDLLFLFWSIGTGIICGAGLYKIAIILAILVTVGIIILDMLPVRAGTRLLIVNADTKEAEDAIEAAVKELSGSYKLKSKNITADGMDLILEIREKNEKELMDRLSEMEQITSVSLLAHDGEVKN